MTQKEIIESLTDYDIVDIMISLGSEDPAFVRDGMLFTTICHGGQKKKLHYHSDEKTFYCYTHCGNIGNIFALVAKVRECSYRDAYEYVCSFFGIATTVLKYGFTHAKVDNSFIRKFEVKEEKKEELTPYDDKVLDRFWSNLFHKSWQDDHISIPTMKLFNIRFDISENRIIIPHYDIDNRLVGIRCRNFDEEKVEDGRKYMPITVNGILYNYSTHLNLYGLHMHKNAIKTFKKVIIGESEKFVLQHHTFYGDNSVAVAISGSAFSDEQMELLKSLDVEEVIIAVDKEFTNEEEEKEYSEKINKTFISKLNPYFKVSIIWDRDNLLEHKMAPTDKGKEVFDKLYKSRIFI